MALLSDLLSYFNGGQAPYQTDAQGQVTSPGILGSFGRGLQNNSDSLLGFGMGMLSGRNIQDGFANASQGYQSGSLMDRQRMIDNRNQLELARRRAAASSYMQAHPDMAKYAVDPQDPAAAQQLATAQFGVDNRPDKYQMLQGSDGFYAVNNTDPTQVTKLNINLAKANSLSPITIRNAEGVEQTIGFQDGSGNRYSMEDAQKLFGGAPLAPPDALGQKGRQQLQEGKAKRVGELYSAGQAADTVGQSADQAQKFIRDYVPDSAIGPYAGSTFNRTISGLTGIGGEKQRQNMETQLNDLALQYRKSVYQGTGQVSDKETEMAAKVLGNPSSYDKGTVLAALEHVKQRSAYTQAFRDFYQQHGGEFGADPDAAYSAFVKDHPLPKSPLAEVAGLKPIDGASGSSGSSGDGSFSPEWSKQSGKMTSARKGVTSNGVSWGF